jgi:hypothetical protein
VTEECEESGGGWSLARDVEGERSELRANENTKITFTGRLGLCIFFYCESFRDTG